MCGIVGLFLKDPKLEPRLGELLTDMLITMTDRGPDSAGIALYGPATPGRPGPPGKGTQDSPLLRYLTAAVFPLYILHQSVIVVLAHNLKPLRIGPALEGPLLIAATFALCLLGYDIIRRIGWLRPLFGLRREPATRQVPDARPAAG